jgi:prepilin-type N-terminal cleavage/methylation domain-containing protein
MNRQNTRRGFSMIEIAIVSVILGVVISIVFAILFTANKAADEGTKTSEAETRARVSVDALKEELFYANLDFGANGSFLNQGHYLRYRIVNKTGTFAYGYYDRNGVFQTNWWVEIDFVADQYYREPNASSSPSPFTQVRFPMNRNAATNDVFVSGHLVKKVYTSAGNLDRTLTIVGDVILNNADLNAGDIDGDGAADPMFELEDGQGVLCARAIANVKIVKINLYIGLFDMDHTKFFLRNCIQQVKLKNAQASMTFP